MLQTHSDTIQHFEILEWIFEDRGPEGLQVVLHEKQQDLALGRHPWVFFQDWNSSSRQAIYVRKLAGDSARIVGLRGLSNGPTPEFMTEVLDVLRQSAVLNRIEYMCPSEDEFRSFFLGLGFRSLAAIQQICLPLDLAAISGRGAPVSSTPADINLHPKASQGVLGKIQEQMDAPIARQLQIVPARQFSTAKLARLIRKTFEGTLDLATNSPVDGYSDHMLIEYFSNDIPLHHLEHWYVAELASKAVGCLLMQMHPQETMELVYMGLTPQSRRRGIGSLLVQEARQTALEHYCNMLVTAVDVQNQPAMRVYERAGFQRYSKIEWLSIAV
ncbi:MAG: GNAT family N-acetyltransferase [Planctomycetota bacterium]